MSFSSLRILRIGLGITFLWLGYQIWLEPEAWGSFMLPWAQNLLGDQSLVDIMKRNAIGDMIIGIWLIIGWRVWIPALLATLHLIGVLATTTANLQIAIPRDIGLLAAALAILIDTLPQSIKNKLVKNIQRRK